MNPQDKELVAIITAAVIESLIQHRRDTDSWEAKLPRNSESLHSNFQGASRRVSDHEHSGCSWFGAF